METNYCRRERYVTATTSTESRTIAIPCGKKITRANALNWCEACREKLPFWPVEHGLIGPAVLPKEIDADDPRAVDMIAECNAVDMTGAVEEVAATLRGDLPGVNIPRSIPEGPRAPKVDQAERESLLAGFVPDRQPEMFAQEVR